MHNLTIDEISTAESLETIRKHASTRGATSTEKMLIECMVRPNSGTRLTKGGPSARGRNVHLTDSADPDGRNSRPVDCVRHPYSHAAGGGEAAAPGGSPARDVAGVIAPPPLIFFRVPGGRGAHQSSFSTVGSGVVRFDAFRHDRIGLATFSGRWH